MARESVELAAAIGAVRSQLEKARAEARGDVVFTVDKVTVELVGEVRTTGGAKGEASFWVFTAGASVEREAGSSQKITVELTPRGQDGPLEVSDTIASPPTE